MTLVVHTETHLHSRATNLSKLKPEGQGYGCTVAPYSQKHMTQPGKVNYVVRWATDSGVSRLGPAAPLLPPASLAALPTCV